MKREKNERNRRQAFELQKIILMYAKQMLRMSECCYFLMFCMNILNLYFVNSHVGLFASVCRNIKTLNKIQRTMQ